MEFVETSVFRQFVRGELGEDGLRALQSDLVDNPALAPIMRGSGGARKLRWAAKGSGKSGGYRIIYFYSPSDERCYLLLGFKKGEQENLTKEQLKALRELIKRHLS